MSKVHLECFYCGDPYYIQNSTASIENQSMFCSKECQETEDARLVEGNKIVHSAIEENPLAFAKSTSGLNFDSSTFAATPQQDIINVVDGMFKKLNQQ